MSDPTDRNWNLTPYAHQWEVYQRTRDTANYALWHDQGLGKTVVCIATIAHLYRTGKIDAVLVIAPGGVESNWVFDEIPKHMPDISHRVFFWSSPKTKTKKHDKDYATFRDYSGLQILCMSYNAMMTDRGGAATKKLMDENHTLYILDEATRIKTPGAKTTKRIMASAKHAAYRRLLNGTPVEDSPFAAYTQCKWVDPTCWEQHGINHFQHFKNRYGIFQSLQTRDGRNYENLVAYQNLEEITAMLRQVGQRLLKEDVLDLPPKVYQMRRFDLSPKARKAYRYLQEEFTLELDGGDQLDAELAIVRMTRFQQITSGYLPRGEDDAEMVPIEPTNPRISLLKEIITDVPGKAIIWCKYNADMDAITAMLDGIKETYVTYDGRTTADSRREAKSKFQDGDARFFVAKPQAAGRGLTLTAATTVIYYNVTFSSDLRKQSEDRAHRIGQEHTVVYIDLVANDTIDEHILATLRSKQETSAIVTGDVLREWVL